MEYDHSRKAGKPGDVWKHSVLLALANVLPATSDTFRYVDTHCGAPVHDLGRAEEWERGVGRFARNEAGDCQYADVTSNWLASDRYPASWVLVVESTCDSVRPRRRSRRRVPAAWCACPSERRRRDFRQTDGYVVAANLAKADLVFLDPPFHPSASAKPANTCCSRRRLV
jgi:23S rRNA A2030 N6-methylase RlmJ